MKRALGLIFIVVAVAVGFLSVRGTMPFLPIYGISMEPTLHTGDLLLIEPLDAGQVKVGDIIVFNVPSAIREHYNYPPVVAHRVITITNNGVPVFRTKGDNTGEDPFSIMPWDLRGKVGNVIPDLGYPLLFMQSKQGMIFVIVALGLLAFYLYSGELGSARKKVQRGVFAPVLEESYRNNKVLGQKIEVTEKRMDSTQQALEKFSAAIELYAQHLASHTSAIQGLSQASHELSKSAAEQNKVLAHLMKAVEQPKPAAQETPFVIEKTIQQPGKVTPKSTPKSCPGCYRSQRERSAEELPRPNLN